MKPLNRPMFKYGGPIKEGIMSGMKDNTGTGLVGDRRYPMTDGRSRHAAVAPFIGPAIQALRIGAQRAIPKIANLFRTQTGTIGAGSAKIPKFPSGTKGRFLPENLKTVQKAGPEMPIYSPNFLGRDPTVKLIGGIYKGVTNPAVKGVGAGAARLVFSPTGLVTGAIYAGGKFFDRDGNEIPEEVVKEQGLTTGRQFTGDEAMVGDPREPLPDSKRKPTKSEENEALKQKYYKIMGLDKMKKDAVYDSLIDASKIVAEEGADLKGSLKSGTLQNKIIQAISGQLDKSAALKKQIDAAILKGEITKDIKANDPAEKNKARLVEKQIELADQKLSGGTLIENIRAGAKDLGNTTSNVYNAIITTYKTEPEVLADTTEAAEFRKKDNYTTDADLVQKIVAADPKKGAGIYIVDKTAVYIDENGNASTLYQG